MKDMPKQTNHIIWDWKATQRVSKDCQSKTRIRFWFQAGVMTAVGGLFFRFTDHRIVPYFLWILTALLLAGLLFSDRILHGFDRTGAWLARAVGTGLTWGLLTPFFYIVFGFGRLVLVLSGRDPLQRKRDPQATSYWSDYPEAETTSRYQKQF